MTGTGEFVPPTVDWLAVWPVGAVLGAAVLGVLLEAFLPRGARAVAQLGVAVAGLVAAAVGVVVLWSAVGSDGVPRTAVSYPERPGQMSMVLDEVSLFLQGSLLLLGLLAVLSMAERGRSDAFAPQASAAPSSGYEEQARARGLRQTEVLPLVMFAVGGMMIFASAADLLTMFVALEVFSLPLYILCGMARHKRLLSQEASVKYFLLGAFSSAIFLFGIAFLYGVTGSVSIAVIRQQLGAFAQAGVDGAGLVEQLPIVVVGVVMVLVGLLFKVGAAPFHAWTPDVYTGAPTPVTGFMAAAVKLAAFGALVRVLFLGLQPIESMWQPALVAVAALTMVLGAVLSVLQNDLKRILAYSSIAHAGFVLTGFTALQGEALRSVLFYVLAYGLSTIAAFGIVALVREVDAQGGVAGEATSLEQWTGLGRRSPLVAGSFALLMLAFAGIPLTSGFTAKFGVFSVAVGAGYAWLAVLGVLASAVTAFVYLRVIVVMYFSQPDAAGATDDPADGGTGSAQGGTTLTDQRTGVVVGVGPLAAAAVVVGVVATVVLGVAPSPFLDLAGAVAVAGP